MGTGSGVNCWPSMKSIVADNANDSKDPNDSVDEWKVVMRTAFLESQSRQFTRGDWYSAFIKVKDALKAVK